MTQKITSVSITTLNYDHVDMSGNEILQYIGVNKDVHVQVKLSHLKVKADSSNVLNQYMSLISAVAWGYLQYSVSQTKSKGPDDQLLVNIIRQIKSTITQTYTNSQESGCIEILFKQCQSNDESFDIRRHFVCKVRPCVN